MSITADPSGAAEAIEAAMAACAREPIHLPGSIQPHGALLVLHPQSLVVLQASANIEPFLGRGVETGFTPFAELLGAALADEVAAWRDSGEASLQKSLTHLDELLQLTGHSTPQGLLLEFERSPAEERQRLDALYPRMQRFLDNVDGESDFAVLSGHAAREVRRLTGFNRVMVYRFDEDWHGSVIAEDGDGALPSYLDLRFPASDIPAQARELYRRQRLRLIPDARYRPMPLLPATSPLDGQPLDLSAVALRSVSPVHLAYMQNMGTAASMSISIVIDGVLWGLISCHHAEPRQVGPPIRSACDFIGQILALQIGSRERGRDAAMRLAAKDLEAELLARVSRTGSVQGGLAEDPEAWLRLAQAQGAVVLRDDVDFAIGHTPSIEQARALALWLHRRPEREDVFATHLLPALYPPAAEFVASGCGVLAVPISALHPHYVLWFRPELIQTVRWGGEPDKIPGPDGALSPRRSFAQWTEQLRGQAQRWSPVEIDSVLSFRNAVVNFVLKRAEERAELSARLETSNRELEAFSYSVSHDLRAPFRHIVGFAQLLGEDEKSLAPRSRHYLDTIVDSALAAGRLVDDLLNFSQLGRSELDMTPVDMAKLASEIRQSVHIDEGDRQVEWHIGELPPAFGDAPLLRQALSNLMDNALKYTRGESRAVILIDGEQRAHETVYRVSDNGVGFDMAYVGKLFGVFQRLHRVEEFEGSGIGLALARRIIDRHGGWIAAEGALGKGATFRFGLPARSSKAARHDSDIATDPAR